jgi:hypothetical protein
MLAALSFAAGILYADSVKERTLTLQFMPQDNDETSSPRLAEGLAARPIDLTFKDGRPSSEAGLVGEGTDDDDHLFPWMSTNPVVEFAKGVLVRTAQGWGVRIEPGSPLTLEVRLTRFFISEKDQAVGSSYAAEVRLAYELKGRDGDILMTGVASGDASRYGRKRSADNCNELLSDAMKKAYAGLFDQQGLQAAWSGKAPGVDAKPTALTPSVLLADVVALKNQGFSPELLIGYISRQTLAAPLTAQDMMMWKGAGLHESVIQAALDRSPNPK